MFKIPTETWGVNRIRIVNVTPHEIDFKDSAGSYRIPRSGYVLTADIKERRLFADGGVEFVTIDAFSPTPEGLSFLKEIEDACGRKGLRVPNDVKIVGSVYAAMAYPGQVCAMTPSEDRRFRGGKPKTMNLTKFTVFLK